MSHYENLVLSKDMYKSAEGFSSVIEKLDPSTHYIGTELGKLDAFQRQLKRFDIKVSGQGSDQVCKFFSTADSAALFPEYVSRAVRQGIVDNTLLENIVASKTIINSRDYRTIMSDQTDDDLALKAVEEGGFIPQTTIKLKENLVRLRKRGRMLVSSYEAIMFQHLDVVTIALKQMGGNIGKTHISDAIDVLINGDGNLGTAAQVITTETAGTLTYTDLINLWDKFEDYQMNTLLVSPDMMKKMLSISELADPATGLNFQGTGALTTPLGANLFKSTLVPANTIIALDRRYALEMVCAGDVMVESDKLIDCQLERAAITSIVGFSVICPNAVKVMRCKA